MKKITYLLLLVPFLCISQWSQVGNDVFGRAAGDLLGRTVSFSGDGRVLAAGAVASDVKGISAGEVLAYEYISGSWHQIGQPLYGNTEYDHMGEKVSLNEDGSVLAVSKIGDDTNGVNSGAVLVYENISGNWVQKGQELVGAQAGVVFGRNVSLSNDGNLLAVGKAKIWRVDGTITDTGAVFVYRFVNGLWELIGERIRGKSAGDLAGTLVELNGDGNLVAFSSMHSDPNGAESGHVSIYENINDTWVQLGQDIVGEAAGDYFGSGLSLSDSGNIVAIGGMYNDQNGGDRGHVKVFEMVGGAWQQMGQELHGESSNDKFGRSVSLNLNGNILAVGALWNYNSGGSAAGHVRVFSFDGNEWIKIGNDIDGGGPYSGFGGDVSMSNSGDSFVVGAWQYDGPVGNGSGLVRVYHNPLLSIESNQFGNNLTIYPNPTSDLSTINLGGFYDEITVSIYNSTGELVGNSISRKTDQIVLDSSPLVTGVYFVKLISESGLANTKLIKN